MSDPLVPVTVTLAAPVAAVAVAVKVRVLVVEVGLGLKLAVTPEGSGPTLSMTLPANPLIGFTVMVLVPVEPCVTVAAVPVSEKLG